MHKSWESRWTMARRRFADGAGYTRHCWECKHAKGWTPNVLTGAFAECRLTGRYVKKYCSPDNPCSHLGIECRYETEVDDGATAA